MTEPTPEDIAMFAIGAANNASNRLIAQDPMYREYAVAAVAALRDAGYLVDGTESCPEGHDADGELAQHYRRVGPWVPVEEEK